ncbi:hypothetical protein EG328_000757 [Venturia inaequalis]|uniref:Uncharacterized protein n=1 Tax=Venturia inaequalis TaxID=5025 RepID=A0A8H3U4T2_VENIN|nr:hypothetical protein EG328_000757 [Venturia inaequalis]
MSENLATTSPPEKDLSSQTITLSAPLDYPPIEDSADIRIPLHWQQTYGKSEDLSNRLHDLDQATIDVHHAVNTEIGDLMHQKKVGATNWSFYVAPANVMHWDKDIVVSLAGPHFYVIEFMEGCADHWVVIDKEVREILKRNYRSLGVEAPPLRYY